MNGLMRADEQCDAVAMRLVETDGNSTCYKGSVYQQLYTEAMRCEDFDWKITDSEFGYLGWH